MTILETVLGNTDQLDESSLLYVHVDKLNGKRLKVTANFARNVSNGYVVVEAPENIEGFLMDNFAKDEQELAFLYDMEEEERVKEHNERERQKIVEWENNRERLIAESKGRYSRLIAELEERESRRIPEWRERERVRREDYDLELAIRQEEAERADLGYAGLVLDALEKRGRSIGAIRSSLRKQFKDEETLSEMRKGWLDKYLTWEGIKDEGIRKKIVDLTNSKEAALSDSLREILIEQLEVEFPDINQEELLPPYKPEPMPEPEPKTKRERPDPGPRPELELKEVTSLLPELESVVIAAYKDEDLVSLNFTQQARDATGINPKEIYDRISGSIRFLNSQYMLVRVVGNGDGNLGNLALAELDANHKGGLNHGVPKLLRNNFQRPANIVEDAYALCLMLWPKVDIYLEDHEKDNEVFSDAKVKEDEHLARAIYRAVLGRKTPLITNLFPKLVEGSISEDQFSKYEDIAQRVKKAFDKGLLDAYDIPFEGKNFKVSANELVDTIRYLVDLLPEELFELRYQRGIVDWAASTIRKYPLIDERGRSLNPRLQRHMESIKSVGSDAKEKASTLASELGILAEGRKDVWKMNIDLRLNVATNVLDRYGIGYTLERNNQMAGK